MLLRFAVILSVFVTTAFGLTCHSSQHNIRGFAENETDVIVACSEDDNYCAYMTGNQKNDDNASEKFLFRGCSLSIQNLTDYNAQCTGEKKLAIHNGDTSGTLYCCDTNNCNPASFVMPSLTVLMFVLFLSISF